MRDTWEMVRRWWWGVRGHRRLRWNLCPVCNSSPPQTDCWVCHGSYKYGPTKMTLERRGLWREKFDTLR